MPSKTLPQQNGNSCAAHCTVIAIAELSNNQLCLDQTFAEKTVWPAIQFVSTGGLAPGIDQLAAAKNSDPRKIITETDKISNKTVKAELVCDDSQKTGALVYVTDLATKQGLGSLFNLIKGGGTSTSLTLTDGVFYNASYLMFNGAKAATGTFTGMHNILVTREGGKDYYYNPNENKPGWNLTSDWKILDNQNGGNHSYVFTGVCVEMKK
ncbi:hypothetical protein [Methylomonas sp. UP202]|uniref:hypothetical protein n=1 Tax=Methylomonas sp. UP202 TaxID=3040943 RepID=UPI00143AE0CB|nr:hypothetical protein [Methylomonas sp. UP202]NJA04719.1 hypothetical protein [Methylococcaceae bacterium WWC4]WGS86112.1 hypothetical protein QC632_24230 [Methylomonas sp. UP202]